MVFPAADGDGVGDGFLFECDCTCWGIGILQDFSFNGFSALQGGADSDIDRKLSCLAVFIYGRGQLCILNLQSAGQFGFRLDAFPFQIAAKRDFFAEAAKIALGIAIQHTNAQIATHHHLTIHGANILLYEVDGLPEDICNFRLGGGKGDFLLDGEAVFQGSGVLLHPQYALQRFNALTADAAQNFCMILTLACCDHAKDGLHADFSIIDNLAVQMLRDNIEGGFHILFQTVDM